MKKLNSHYKNGSIEPFHVIDDWNLDFYLDNIVKYIQRHKHKGSALEDIQKAIDYLKQYQQRMKK